MNTPEQLRQRQIARNNTVTKWLASIPAEVFQRFGNESKSPEIDMRDQVALFYRSQVLHRLRTLTFATGGEMDNSRIIHLETVDISEIRDLIPHDNDRVMKDGIERGINDIIGLLAPGFPPRLTWGMALQADGAQNYQFDTETAGHRHGHPLHKLHIPTVLDNVELILGYEGDFPFPEDLPKIDIQVYSIE